MNNFKVAFLKELENKVKLQFFSSETGISLSVLPPILKRINLKLYMFFIVINKPNIEDNYCYKNPIAIIKTDTKTDKILEFFDLTKYDFCNNEVDFCSFKQNIPTSKNFYPNLDVDQEEALRLYLEELFILSQKKYFNPNKKEYLQYLKNISKFIPENFSKFYNYLQKSDIISLDYTRIINSKNVDKVEIKIVDTKILQNRFLKDYSKKIFSFVKNEIVPSLIGKGSFSKLIFYNELGQHYLDVIKNVSQYKQCYDQKITFTKTKENFETFLNNKKLEIIKIYLNSTNNNYQKDLNIDTLSKILIVYLNAIFIEEKKQKIIKEFEDEIAESRQIFLEEINKISDIKAKNILIDFYNDLNKDYYEIDESKFSPLFTSYLKVFSINQELNLIKID